MALVIAPNRTPRRKALVTRHLLGQGTAPHSSPNRTPRRKALVTLFLSRLYPSLTRPPNRTPRRKALVTLDARQGLQESETSQPYSPPKGIGDTLVILVISNETSPNRTPRRKALVTIHSPLMCLIQVLPPNRTPRRKALVTAIPRSI